eukprot:TRINITY_DN66102_c0_g1_i2.p2 TRINITY_DN66102_c0_g1~~TRINITY_DN66102_c0_g1_i2.p2  ORF type:complete len:195 (+),score=54.66 TRINITY_DN66102_c0_g1_i2:83-667(+)
METASALGAADETGWRHWDASRLLESLLTSAGKEGLASPLSRQPETVLELGAGCGALAVAVASKWRGAALQQYIATDLEANLGPIRDMVKLHEVADLVEARALPWGERPRPCKMLADHVSKRAFDLVLLCEVLYWGGWDLWQDDALDLLTASLEAVMGPQELLDYHAPAEPSDPDRFTEEPAGGYVAAKLVRAA